MYFELFNPIPELSPYIESFWIIQASGKMDVTEDARMPADSRAILLFNLSDDPRITDKDGTIQYLTKGGNLLGTHCQSYVLEHEGETHLVAVQFRPGGLAPFVNCDVGELAEDVSSLSMLWGNEGNWLCEQIYEVNTGIEKVVLCQNALLKHFVEVPHQSNILHSLA